MSADSEPFDLAAAQITDRIRESLDELAEFGAIPPDDTQTVLLRGRWRGRDAGWSWVRGLRPASWCLIRPRSVGGTNRWLCSSRSQRTGHRRSTRTRSCVALVWIEIGDHAQQQALSGTGFACNGHALAGLKQKIDWVQMEPSQPTALEHRQSSAFRNSRRACCPAAGFVKRRGSWAAPT